MRDRERNATRRRISEIYFLIVILIIIAIIISAIFLVRSSFTGKAIGDFSFNQAVSGEKIEGVFYYDLSQGVLPLNSVVRMNVNGYGKELPLSLLVKDAGLKSGLVDFPNKVQVVLSVKNSQGVVDEVSIDDLRMGRGAVIPVKSGESASVKEARVRGNIIDKNYVSLVQEGNLVNVATSYSEKLQGYSFENNDKIALDIGAFELVSPLNVATVQLTFRYLEEEFAYTDYTIDLNARESPARAVNENGEECGVNIVCSFVTGCAVPSFSSIVKNPDSLVKVRIQQCRDTICGDTFVRSMPCSEGESVPVKIEDSGRFGLSPSDKQEGSVKAGKSELNWGKTYDYTDVDIVSYGSLSKELSEKSRIKLNVNGAEHSVGVYEVVIKDGKRYADIEVASTPERALIAQGGSHGFDLTDDNSPDIEVSVIAIDDKSAVININSFNAALFSPLADDEKAISLVNRDLNVPLAHLAFNKKEDSLRVILVQSDKTLAAHCSDGIENFDEGNIDCGGLDCNKCKVERDERFYPLILSWLAFMIFLLALVSIAHKRII